MPSMPAPSPHPGNNDTVNIAICTAREYGSRAAVTDIADPVFLFSKDYDDNNGRVQDIASGEKRPAPPRKKSASSIACMASPVNKKSNTSSSPPPALRLKLLLELLLLRLARLVYSTSHCRSPLLDVVIGRHYLTENDGDK